MHIAHSNEENHQHNYANYIDKTATITEPSSTIYGACSYQINPEYFKCIRHYCI